MTDQEWQEAQILRIELYITKENIFLNNNQYNTLLTKSIPKIECNNTRVRLTQLADKNRQINYKNMPDYKSYLFS